MASGETYPVDVAAAVLGAILREPELSACELERAGVILRPDDFTGRHRSVYAGVLACWRDEEPIALETVARHVGGELPASYVSDLVDRACLTGQVGAFGKIIVEAGLRRQVAAIAAEGARRATEGNGGDPAGWLQEQLIALEQRRHAGGFRPIGAVTDAVLEDMREAQAHPGRLPGLSTGLAALDRLTGGLTPGSVTVVGAATSTGKSAFAFQVAASNAQVGNPVAIISLEMTSEEIHRRLIASAAGVTLSGLSAGGLSEIGVRKAEEAAAEIRRLPIFVRDRAGLELAEIPGAAFVAVRLHGARLLIVDYLQLIDGPGETQEAQVAAVSRALKTTALRLGIPVLVLAQLNREAARRESGVPRLSDLRGSGRIEQDADAVWLLWRERDPGAEIGPPAPSGPVNVLVTKNRNGATGVVRLHWEAESTRFSDARADR